MRTTRYAAGLVAGALLLTGCATLPQPRTDSEADWRPIPSKKELAAASERFDTTAVRAMTELEAQPLADAFSGPLLRTNRAAVELAKKSDNHDTEPAGHGDPVFHRPAFDDYPIWYLIESTATDPGADDGKGSGPRPDRTDLTVVQSTGAEDPWRAALRTEVPTKKLPELDAAAIPNDDKEKLGRTPASIARTFADVLQSREKNPDKAKLFTSSDAVSQRLEASASWAEQEKESDGNVTIALEAKPTVVRTLATSKGDALMVFAISVEQHLGTPNGRVTINDKDDPVRVSLGQKDFHEFIHSVREWTVVARVPPNPSPDQKVELLSVRNDFVQAEGR